MDWGNVGFAIGATGMSGGVPAGGSQQVSNVLKVVYPVYYNQITAAGQAAGLGFSAAQVLGSAVVGVVSTLPTIVGVVR
jgi:hypothetical protein